MIPEWPQRTLADAGVMLFDCVHATPEDVGTGYPYVAIPQMKAGRIDLEGARRVTRADFLKWTEKALPMPFDVVLSRRCNPGVTAHVPRGLQLALGQNLVILRADGRHVYPPCLRWLVAGPEWWLEMKRILNVGAVFDSLKCRDVPGVRLTIPPLVEQRRIAAVLGALDDKIELNRQMNRTLEEMAQARFKSWFVDFDGHSEFEHSDLGRIPRGWTCSPLDSIATFLNGAACQKYRPADGEASLPVVKIRELREGVGQDTERVGVSIPEKWHLTDGDLLFSWSGSLALGWWYGGPAALNQHLFKVSSELLPKWYVYLWLQHHLPHFQRIAASKATTMGHIQRHHLTQALVMVPSKSVLDEMDRLAAPLLQRLELNLQQSRTLTALRDLLLPRLISGQLRVPESLDDALAALQAEAAP